MEGLTSIIIFIILVALIFDAVNGFHDAANSIATVVSTRVLTPSMAVLWAAFFNFVAMFIFAPKVANTISKIVSVNPSDPVFIYVVLAGLVGAIFWDLITWYWGLPTSSSHALIGGFAGAGIAHKGLEVINWSKVTETIMFIPLAPIIGMTIGYILMVLTYWVFRKWKPSSVDKFFRKGQLFSAALYSLGHGANDAQKTMGIIVALLVAGGIISPDLKLSLTDSKTLWIILSCHLSMAIGTSLGGWRIVKTMGMKLAKLKPVHGFCAESGGALSIFLATLMGIPISTTHTIAGSIIGVGSTTNIAGINWKIAIRIVFSWILTIPLSALVGAITLQAIKILL